MKYLSVCSGIEAATVAWHGLGWEPLAFSEIEPFPSAVLAHHYPAVPNLGDMTTLPNRILSGEIDAPDVLCGGTPCQAFSVAGRRLSLADARGNLSLVFCDIADAIDESRSVRGFGAAIILWENVPGVLSTADNAFGCFLAQLCGGDEPLAAPDGWPDAGCVSGPKRTAAWRILDAQYFGLAQRRRRVFVIASARDDFDPAAVLFEFDGVRRDTAPRREAGERVAAGVEERAEGGRWWDGGDVAATITTKSDNQRMPDKDNAQLVMQPVTHSLRGEGFDASEDGTGRGTPLVPVSVPDVAGTMLSMKTSGSWSNSADFAAAGYMVPVAFHPTQDPISSTEVCHSIGANDNATAAVAQPVTEYYSHDYCQDRIYSTEGMSPALNCSQDHTFRVGMQVRRLTPVECERLQGFPDGYTAIPWRGKPASECPDGPRYKGLGNSWAVPVVRWIGQRIDRAVRQA